MALKHRDGRRQIFPTRPRQVYDITGAGDMVMAALGMALASGVDYDQAIPLANVAGGLSPYLGGCFIVRDRLAAAAVVPHGPWRFGRLYRGTRRRRNIRDTPTSASTASAATAKAPIVSVEMGKEDLAVTPLPKWVFLLGQISVPKICFSGNPAHQAKGCSRVPSQWKTRSKS